MTDSFVIWGSSGHAKVVAGIIRSQGDEVIAFFDNKDVGPAIPGVPFYLGEAGFRDWLQSCTSLDRIKGVAAIGGSGGADRRAILELFRSNGLATPTLVHPDSSVCDTARLGTGNQVLAQSVVAAEVVTGSACILNNKSSVDHESHLEDGVHVGPGATICGCVHIESNVFVGAGAVILPRLTIGAGAIIGAGSVVTKNVPSKAVCMGNPARF